MVSDTTNAVDSGSESDGELIESNTTTTAAAATVDLSLPGVWRQTLRHVEMSSAIYRNDGGGRIALLACFLGVVIGTGLQWILFSTGIWRQFGFYAVFLATFHLLEFAWMAIFHPLELTARSFLLNHSREYHVALAAGLGEFIVEAFLFPSWKYPYCTWVMWLGVLIVALGQAVRTLAMFTAASNFTHIVAESRRPNHVLVTEGIYSWVRHPSYAGWFWWSVGTQILLANRLCTIAYSYASYRFFKARIQQEEEAMLRFFGNDYVQYQKRVPSGVPLVKGYGL